LHEEVRSLHFRSTSWGALGKTWSWPWTPPFLRSGVLEVECLANQRCSRVVKLGVEQSQTCPKSLKSIQQIQRGRLEQSRQH
jgi:hypothetical protein